MRDQPSSSKAREGQQSGAASLPSHRRRSPRIIGLAVAAALASCAGSIEEPSGATPDDPSDGPGIGADGLPNYRHSPGIRRLTQNEYKNLAEDLLGVAVPLDRIPKERIVAGHGQIAMAQAIGYDEVERFYELGAELAGEAVATLACDPQDGSCARDWAADFLRLALRGADAELAAPYLALLDDASAGATPRERLMTLISTVLSSPEFLYRREIGEGQVQGSSRRLTPAEVASRLSFLIWQSGPDAMLLDAAESGALADPEQRVMQLERMLADPRARRGLQGFVFDWMGLTQGGIASKDPEILEGTPATLAALAEESLRATVDEVLFTQEAGLAALLGTERYVVEREVAAIVGVEASELGEELEERALDSTQRRGILMHPTVLSAHTKESGASPFSLGKFINEHLLCTVITSPPTIPEVDESEIEGETFRERLEFRTSGAACQSCHALIGPPGFAFLNFDPIGRYRATDSQERAFDTAGSLLIDAELTAFDNASDMAGLLAEHPKPMQCVARRMFRWAFGYFEGEDDRALVDALEGAAVGSRGQIRELLDAVVRSEDFVRVRVSQ